jgi:hypothetical protein
MAHQDDRTGSSRRALGRNLRHCRFPGEMTDGLGLDALAAQFVSQGIHAGGEHAEPAAQQIDLGLGESRRAAEQDKSKHRGRAAGR